jgi:hypothetical protein
VDQLYLSAKISILRCLYAQVSLALVSAWLSWLQSGELFGMDWDGVDVAEPPDGPTRGLPLGVGTVLWKLLAQSKSNRTSRADIAMAYIWPAPVYQSENGSINFEHQWASRLFPTRPLPLSATRMAPVGHPSIFGQLS